MQFFNRKNTNEFLNVNQRGDFGPSLDVEFHDQGFFQSQFKIPIESGRLLSLSRFLASIKRRSEWTLVIVENGGIWPSWEDLNLYNMLRSARDIEAEPACGDSFLFSSQETSDLATFANVFASFRYDFRIIDSQRELHAFFSHDDWFFLQMAESLGNSFSRIVDYTQECPAN